MLNFPISPELKKIFRLLREKPYFQGFFAWIEEFFSSISPA